MEWRGEPLKVKTLLIKDKDEMRNKTIVYDPSDDVRKTAVGKKKKLAHDPQKLRCYDRQQ